MKIRGVQNKNRRRMNDMHDLIFEKAHLWRRSLHAIKGFWRFRGFCEEFWFQRLVWHVYMGVSTGAHGLLMDGEGK